MQALTPLSHLISFSRLVCVASLQQKAEARVTEADVVAIYDRFAESLHLVECKTGLSTRGHQHRRVAVPHPNAGQPGHPDAAAAAAVAAAAASGASSSTSSTMTAADLEKFERWRSLMRKDPEVLAILQRELTVYAAALVVFEAQLRECGIVRNGSKVRALAGRGAQASSIDVPLFVFFYLVRLYV